ncbi:PDZ domain-containing protein [Mesorhizobium sp. BR1-1-16]|uniref:PDZ domain-containing protein n=1 Tax=Mesorhizobium sp. BR1-1-16 TaxID=2876653 RepID=UPI001CD01710|nr:PDZ domain-containing protein [Mesorhizobium sp. BR1-1-16]MBZ9936638.1 PDZ domain-containing protein [Mesorhizobium sp. BR1-1-16]
MKRDVMGSRVFSAFAGAIAAYCGFAHRMNRCWSAKMSLAALFAMAAVFFAGPVHSQSFTGRDPDSGELLAPGRAVGNYLQASGELQDRIQSLRAILDRCGQCEDRAALEQELDEAVEKWNTIKKGEGIALKSLNLPGKDFGDFVNRLRGFGTPDRPAELLEFDAQLDRTIVNYCTIASRDAADVDGCLRKYRDHRIREDAADAVEICYRQVRGLNNASLHDFPPPDADPKLVAAHKALWIEFEACLKEKNAFEMMRVVTNEACSFEDLSANLDGADFVCACKGFPEERRAACPGNAHLPQPVAPNFDFPDEPVVKMLAPDGYGPTYMGVRLGQAMVDADHQIRLHMQVASVYDLRTDNHPFFGGEALQLPRDKWRWQLGGRLYVNGDGSEYVAVMTAANLPGRVFELEHTALVPAEQESVESAALIAEQGGPTGQAFNGTGQMEAWGMTNEQAPRCMPWLLGLDKKEWNSLEGEAEVASKSSANLERLSHGEKGLYGQLALLVMTNPSFEDKLLYKCGPVLQAFYEDMGYRNGDKQHDWNGVPALVTRRLFDTSLIRWYEIQQSYKHNEMTGVPVAPYALNARLNADDSEAAPEQRTTTRRATMPTVLGMELSSLDITSRTRSAVKDAVKGVPVIDVDPNSLAAERHIRAGDTIVEMNQEAVNQPSDVPARMKALKDQGRRSAVFLITNAQGETRFVSLPLN